MLNRWQGNSGKVERIDEKRFSAPPPPCAAAPAAGKEVKAGKETPKNERGVLERLGKLLPGITEKPDTEDILLLLILYLMYRESGDSELLIILGAMFLL